MIAVNPEASELAAGYAVIQEFLETMRTQWLPGFEHSYQRRSQEYQRALEKYEQRGLFLRTLLGKPKAPNRLPARYPGTTEARLIQAWHNSFSRYASATKNEKTPGTGKEYPRSSAAFPELAERVRVPSPKKSTPESPSPENQGTPDTDQINPRSSALVRVQSPKKSTPESPSPENQDIPGTDQINPRSSAACPELAERVRVPYPFEDSVLDDRFLALADLQLTDSLTIDLTIIGPPGILLFVEPEDVAAPPSSEQQPHSLVRSILSEILAESRLANTAVFTGGMNDWAEHLPAAAAENSLDPQQVFRLADVLLDHHRALTGIRPFSARETAAKLAAQEKNNFLRMAATL